jgi:hypothetical protein
MAAVRSVRERIEIKRNRVIVTSRGSGAGVAGTVPVLGFRISSTV